MHQLAFPASDSIQFTFLPAPPGIGQGDFGSPTDLSHPPTLVGLNSWGASAPGGPQLLGGLDSWGASLWGGRPQLGTWVGPATVHCGTGLVLSPTDVYAAAPEASLAC